MTLNRFLLGSNKKIYKKICKVEMNAGLSGMMICDMSLTFSVLATPYCKIT